LVAGCVAHAQGRPTAYPVKTRKLKRGQRANALLWLEQAGRCWLVQRPATGVWAGLWSLPEFDDADTLRALLAHWPGAGEWQPAVKHVLTHLDWTLQPRRCWRACCWPSHRPHAGAAPPKPWRWAWPRRCGAGWRRLNVEVQGACRAPAG
jgi:adenine-specific DNA glycosylase